MRMLFIRHGLTAGNLQKRYIGRTDQPLCQVGIDRLKSKVYPPCQILVCSPMERCLQTAKIIFPQQEIITDNDLRECDFGRFEGKNYTELSGDPDYQRWIDSGGNLPFPGGESPQSFKERCVRAFGLIAEKYRTSGSVCFVVHGGTIMSILEKYAVPAGSYYDWHCENGCGYLCQWNGSELHIMERI
ncbi:MAG TPA: histidine phosphatase family protein [Ruminococcus sp.]|nr:histidine phosphatase family protein [Ruminococcus sp.]